MKLKCVLYSIRKQRIRDQNIMRAPVCRIFLGLTCRHKFTFNVRYAVSSCQCRRSLCRPVKNLFSAQKFCVFLCASYDLISKRYVSNNKKNVIINNHTSYMGTYLKKKKKSNSFFQRALCYMYCCVPRIMINSCDFFISEYIKCPLDH